MNNYLLKNWINFIGLISIAILFTLTGCEKSERIILETRDANTGDIVDTNDPSATTYTETQDITKNVLVYTTLTDIHDDPEMVDYRVTVPVWNIENQLYIESGVVIEFVEDAAVHVKETGTISSYAYGANPIRFTGKEKAAGSWIGIIGDPDSKISLDGAIIEFAGRALNSDDITGSAIRSEGVISLTDSEVKQSAGYGIRTFNDGYFGYIQDNSFTDNAKAAISTTVDHLHAIHEQKDFTGNGHNGVQIRTSAFVNGPCPEPWETLTANGSGSYLIQNDDPLIPAEISIETNLQIQPGVTVQFGEGASMLVNADLGMLTANGTAGSPITFEGKKAEKGSWKGIYLEHSLETSYLSYVTIKHAGSEVFDAQNLPLQGNIGVHNAFLVISNSTISDSQGCAFAISQTPENSVQESNNVYSNNGGGLYCGN